MPNIITNTNLCFLSASASEGPDICAYILTTISILLIMMTFPFSLIFCIKVGTTFFVYYTLPD